MKKNCVDITEADDDHDFFGFLWQNLKKSNRAWVFHVYFVGLFISIDWWFDDNNRIFFSLDFNLINIFFLVNWYFINYFFIRFILINLIEKNSMAISLFSVCVIRKFSRIQFCTFIWSNRVYLFQSTQMKFSFHGFDISFPFHQKQSCGIIIIIIELLTEGSYTGNTQSLSHWPFEQFNSFFIVISIVWLLAHAMLLCVWCVFSQRWLFFVFGPCPENRSKKLFQGH